MDDSGGRRGLGWETALGGLLLLLGIVVWLGQAFELDLGRVGWPFLVIVPGLALLGVGLAAAGRLGEVLATVGGLVTMAGLVLLVQNATDRFDTWAYAWTLVVIGIGGRPVGSGGRYGLAALLIVAGLVLLGHRLLAARRPRACQTAAEPKGIEPGEAESSWVGRGVDRVLSPPGPRSETGTADRKAGRGRWQDTCSLAT